MSWMTKEQQQHIQSLLKKGFTQKAKKYEQQKALSFIVEEANVRDVPVTRNGTFVDVDNYYLYGSKIRNKGNKEYTDYDPSYIVSMIDINCPLRKSFINMINETSSFRNNSSIETLQIANDIFSYIKKHGYCEHFVMKYTIMFNVGDRSPVYRRYNCIMKWLRNNNIISSRKTHTLHIKDVKKANIVWSYICELML
jgi:hypothetical protein